jgi:hypothetical protein
MSGWISVKDRLPKCDLTPDSFGVPVLVYPAFTDSGSSDMVQAFYGCRQTDEPNFYVFGRIFDPTHWMPMPAPPTEKSAVPCTGLGLSARGTCAEGGLMSEAKHTCITCGHTAGGRLHGEACLRCEDFNEWTPNALVQLQADRDVLLVAAREAIRWRGSIPRIVMDKIVYAIKQAESHL